MIMKAPLAGSLESVVAFGWQQFFFGLTGRTPIEIHNIALSPQKRIQFSGEIVVATKSRS